jgi:AP-1 complex subunit mu
MSAVEKFPVLLSEAEEESSAVPPCFSSEGINYLYIRHNNLYLLALTKRNSNAAELLLFLHKIVEVFTEYFKELEEESIRDNFVVIYELLDEMMDFGYPQTTESKILQEYITQESHKLDVQARPPIAVTNAVSWRSEGIRYRKNEVFLDVVESLNLLVSANGNVLRSEILGAVKMKCYLSGMPELRLGLNDKVMFETTGRATRGKAVEMEDVKFHQCVRLSRFENDRTISFIPPDGEFELMSYRLNTQVKPLIWVECIVESHSGSRIEYMLKVNTPPRICEAPTNGQHRRKHSLRGEAQQTMCRSRYPYLKTPTHLVSAQTSVQCITRQRHRRLYGRSSNSEVARSS